MLPLPSHAMCVTEYRKQCPVGKGSFPDFLVVQGTAVDSAIGLVSLLFNLNCICGVLVILWGWTWRLKVLGITNKAEPAKTDHWIHEITPFCAPLKYLLSDQLQYQIASGIYPELRISRKWVKGKSLDYFCQFQTFFKKKLRNFMPDKGFGSGSLALVLQNLVSCPVKFWKVLSNPVSTNLAIIHHAY